MTILEAIDQRHSVRQYEDKAIEPEAFQANKPSYGQFSDCRNYFALVGKKGLDEEIG